MRMEGEILHLHHENGGVNSVLYVMRMEGENLHLHHENGGGNPAFTS